MRSNRSHRLTPRRRMTWPFMRSRQLAIAVIAFSKREEGLIAQSPEYVALRKAHTNFDFGFIARLSWTGRKHADPVMSSHHSIAAIDLRIVERSLVNAALEIVRHDEPRHAAKE